MNACGGGYLPHRFSKENGYDNPSMYCNDFFSMLKNVQSVLESFFMSVSQALNRVTLTGALSGDPV
jgi:uncharacterized protein